MIPARIITAPPQRRPGIYPAIKRAAIDTLPAMLEYTIIVLLGGISIPTGAEATFTAVL